MITSLELLVHWTGQGVSLTLCPACRMEGEHAQTRMPTPKLYTGPGQMVRRFSRIRLLPKGKPPVNSRQFSEQHKLH